MFLRNVFTTSRLDASDRWGIEINLAKYQSMQYPHAVGLGKST